MILEKTRNNIWKRKLWAEAQRHPHLITHAQCTSPPNLCDPKHMKVLTHGHIGFWASCLFQMIPTSKDFHFWDNTYLVPGNQSKGLNCHLRVRGAVLPPKVETWQWEEQGSMALRGIPEKGWLSGLDSADVRGSLGKGARYLQLMHLNSSCCRVSSQVPESGGRFIQSNTARNAERLNSKKGSEWQVKGPGSKNKQQITSLMRQDSSNTLPTTTTQLWDC